MSSLIVETLDASQTTNYRETWVCSQRLLVVNKQPLELVSITHRILKEIEKKRVDLPEK